MTSAPDSVRMKHELAKLVAINTENPPGREAEAAAYVAEVLGAADFDVTLTEYKSGRFNLEARLSNGPGPVFAFNTHMDTVPAGDGWSSDPFILSERGGKLYGRGACDCKGPLVAMLEAMRLLAGTRRDWSGTLVGVFVGDEEIASEGARHYAASRPRIDYAVVGEPTSNTTFSAHKGSLRPIVRVHGVAAHSGTPELGENAIYQAGKLLALIEAHHRDVIRLRSHPLVGAPSLTVTRMNGGHADNVLPAECDLLLDRRLVPGESEDAARQDIAALLDAARTQAGIRAEIIGYKATTGGATETAADSRIVQAGLVACRANGVRNPGPFGFQGACDLVHFNTLGAQGVVVGPGDLAVAHKPDEFVPEDEFIACSLIYRDIAKSILAV